MGVKKVPEVIPKILMGESFEINMVSLSSGAYIYNQKLHAKVDLRVDFLPKNIVHSVLVEFYDLKCHKSNYSFKFQMFISNYTVKQVKKKQKFFNPEFRGFTENLFEQPEIIKRFCRVPNAHTTFNEILDFWDFRAYSEVRNEVSLLKKEKTHRKNARILKASRVKCIKPTSSSRRSPHT